MWGMSEDRSFVMWFVDKADSRIMRTTPTRSGSRVSIVLCIGLCSRPSKKIGLEEKTVSFEVLDPGFMGGGGRNKMKK